MKISNDFGNKMKGSIGEQVTASDWKGRNYLKAYKKPSNPSTPQQEEKRGWLSDGMVKWQSFDEWQRMAYVVHEKFWGRKVSPFNSFMRIWMERKVAGLGYTDPIVVTLLINSNDPGGRLIGAKFTTKRTGETGVYREVFQDTTAGIKHAFSQEDENYDYFYTAEGYLPASFINRVAEWNNRTVTLVKIV